MSEELTVTQLLEKIGLGGVSVGLLGKIVWDWWRARRANENGSGKTMICGVHDGMVDKLETKLDSISGKIDALNEKLVDNYAKRSEVAEIAADVRALVERDAKLEAEVTVLKSQVATLLARAGG